MSALVKSFTLALISMQYESADGEALSLICRRSN